MIQTNNYNSLIVAGLAPFDGCNFGTAEAFCFELNNGLTVTVYTDNTPAEYYKE